MKKPPNKDFLSSVTHGISAAADAKCVNRIIRGMAKFLLVFSLIVVTLFAIELTAPAQTWFVIPWTEALAKTAAFLLTSFDSSVIAQGKMLATVKGNFGVTIEAGCNGVEALIILVAAMLAFPAPWLHRIVGILIGSVTVQALNLVRVISLFYIGQWNFTVFEWMHLYVWQALIMLDVLLVWVLWIRALPPAAKPSSTNTTANAAF